MNYHVEFLFPGVAQSVTSQESKRLQARPKTEDDNIYLPNGLVPIGTALLFDSHLQRIE